MLKSLSIRNVVLIDKLDLDFQDGFGVLSGETGAGKSILLDAVGLILGKRADVGMIRAGCDKLSVSGCFEIINSKSELQQICEEYDLDFDCEIIIKRTLASDGKGKIFFNDQPITQKLLKEIGAYLVEVHGQFDNQGLLNSSTHRDVLDGYGGYILSLNDMREAFCLYKKAKCDREEAERKISEAKIEEDNLRHWIDEFNRIQPKKNELEELEIKRKEMINSEKIIENLNIAYKSLNQSLSVRDAIRQSQSSIARVNALLDDKYINISELLDTALVNIDAANEEIESVSSEISLNQNEIDEIEERLFMLKSLARKHNTIVDDLPMVWEEMRDKIAHLEKGEEDLFTLRKNEDLARLNYIKKAEIVSDLRKNAARNLDDKIKLELPDLKLEKARFVTKIERKEETSWNEDGIDDVCFMVSTNPNTPYGAISKIASGGELARFMLALKVNLAQTSKVETMIFDEVDAGVGGATAKAVGDKLAKLGKNVQVLVVTHSPQVAAKSEYHFKVEKHTENDVTTTYLRKLSDTEKMEEIARMISGEYITDEARAAAKVLIGA
ncbi:DNA repair protein RecN [bacterium]|nr:DNA repair protein RecN [bacterium]